MLLDLSVLPERKARMQVLHPMGSRWNISEKKKTQTSQAGFLPDLNHFLASRSRNCSTKPRPTKD